MKHKELELYKSIVSLKENPALIFKRTNLSKKELEEFHEDIADILASLKEAHSKMKVPVGINIPINVGSTINTMIQEAIQGLRKKYLDPLRKTSNLKRTFSSCHITVDISSNPAESVKLERPQKLRRFNSDGSKSADKIETTSPKAEPPQTESKLKRSKTLGSSSGLSFISSNFGFMQNAKSRPSPTKALPKIPDCVQRDITFLQRIQPIFQALDGKNNKENPKENSSAIIRLG